MNENVIQSSEKSRTYMYSNTCIFMVKAIVCGIIAIMTIIFSTKLTEYERYGIFVLKYIVSSLFGALSFYWTYMALLNNKSYVKIWDADNKILATHELTRAEIAEYYSNVEWEKNMNDERNYAYMNGKYYGYIPPNNELDVQLMLICRLFHHGFITCKHPRNTQVADCLRFSGMDILYKSDLELLDPRYGMGQSVITDPEFKTSSIYNWFCNLVYSTNWESKLALPGYDELPISEILIVGTWHKSTTPIVCKLPLDEHGVPQSPTIRTICNIIFPYIINTWITEHKFVEYSAKWSTSEIHLSGEEAYRTLVLCFSEGYHIDNDRYANGCYELCEKCR